MRLKFIFGIWLFSCFSLAAEVETDKPSPIRTRARVAQPGPPVVDTAKGANTGTACYHDTERALSAVHASYPVGSRVKVTNLRNQKTVIVTISGHASLTGRLISLSRDAADQLDFVTAGTTPAKVELVR